MKACFKQRPIAARAEMALHLRAQATFPEDTGFVAEPHGGSQPPVTRYRGPDAFFWSPHTPGYAAGAQAFMQAKHHTHKTTKIKSQQQKP